MISVDVVDRHGASQYLRERWGLRRGVGYLQQIAKQGRDRQGNDGPAFRMAGRFPVYATDELDAYAERVLGEPITKLSERSVKIA